MQKVMIIIVERFRMYRMAQRLLLTGSGRVAVSEIANIERKASWLHRE